MSRSLDRRRGAFGWLLVIACVATWSLAAGAGPADGTSASRPAPPGSAPRAKTCLVLSGGGARGFAHVGALRVLEAMRIPIDCVVGTSMGAVIGGLYASGLPVARIERLMRETDWSRIATDRAERAELGALRKRDDFDYPLGFDIGIARDGPTLATGVMGGARFEQMLQSVLAHVPHGLAFDRLPIPFRSVATDLETGRQVVLYKGNLYEAVRASMSVPGLFSPIEVGGDLLADGGLVNNLPIDVARQMGAERVIAVNIGTPLAPREQLRSLVDVYQQMINILTEQNVDRARARLRDGDVLVSPQMRDLSFADFDRAAEAIEVGALATKARAIELAAYSLERAPWAEHLAARKRLATREQALATLSIAPMPHVPEQAVRRALELAPGQPIDAARLSEAMARVQAMGDFERVSYSLTEAGEDRVDLRVKAHEKPWGPDFLRIGAGLSVGTDSEGSFDLRIGHLRTWLNGLGAQWRTDFQLGRQLQIRSELFQPLSLGSPFSLVVGAGYQRVRRNLFVGEAAALRLRLSEGELHAGASAQLGRWGQVAAGWSRRWIHARTDVGGFLVADPVTGSLTVTPLDARFSYPGLFANLVIDRLDSPFLPRRGFRVQFDGFFANLGRDRPDARFRKLSLDAIAAISIGEHTISPGLRMGRITGATGTAIGFTLGGFQNLSGLRPDELSGNHMSLARLDYYYALKRVDLFGRRLFAGGSIEYGNVWDARPPGGYFNGLQRAYSLYLAAQSPLGPVYAAWGRTSGRKSAIYLFLGRP